MNKRERQVIKLELDKEQKVLDDLERQYKKALKDIDDKIKVLQGDELTQSRIYQIQYQKALRGQVEGILDKLHGDEYATIQQYLHDAYQDGFIGTMYSTHGQGIPLIVPLDQDAAVKAILTDSKISEGLYNHLGVNVKQLKQAIRSEITRGIASNMPFADIARNISNRSKASLGRAKTIVRTEAHRIQQAAAADARDAAKERGCDVVKQWDGTLDGDTRPTHRRLDGQIRETDEPFEMDGKTAMQPGDFGEPEEDCNCRCVALTRAKWALDEEELKTLKERAKFYELDKAKDFAEFREKYLKATQNNDEAVGTVAQFKTGAQANEYFGKRLNRSLRRENPEEYARQREEYEKSQYGRWYSTLSGEEIASIRDYTGDDYAGINGLLRGEVTEKMAQRWNAYSDRTLHEKIEHITAAIEDFELDKPIMVYRTCEEDVFMNLRREIGSIFVDEGFGSTSALPAKVASGNVRMQITVPKGKGYGAWVNPISYKEDVEYEFLLQRGTAYRVDAIDTVDGETVIKMTVVGNERPAIEYATPERVAELWKKRGLWTEDSWNEI